MQKIIEKINEKNPAVKMKKFEFLELDFVELFGDLIPHYVEQLKGVRIWREDDEKYSIQENSVFQVGLNAEEVVKRLVDSYERFERRAKMEEKAREVEEERKAREKLMEMKNLIQSRQDLSEATINFLVDALKSI